VVRVVVVVMAGLFLDPKGRGAVTGYDMAVALPGLQNGIEGDEELFKENNKIFDVTNGNIEFEINKVDSDDGEIGGVFVSTQFSDTDMGSKAPKKILLKGIFYGRIEQ
jgi:photosystem II oxygen-evolving enhancer protein 1